MTFEIFLDDDENRFLSSQILFFPFLSSSSRSDNTMYEQYVAIIQIIIKGPHPHNITTNPNAPQVSTVQYCIVFVHIMMLPSVMLSTQRIVQGVLAGATTSTSTSACRRSLRLPACRRFQSLAEYDAWRQAVCDSALVATNLSPLVLKESAPFLHSVNPMADHLQLSGYTCTTCSTSTTKKSPRSAFLQCTFPLQSDALLQNSVSDLSDWSSFRLGKFYETVDALTADVAYRHCAGTAEQQQQQQLQSVTLVTAGHYHSRKLSRTHIQQDALIRSYVTSVGTSSMEIRTDAIQLDPKNQQQQHLVNVCHTVMVALDPESGKPLGKVGKRIPPLELETSDDRQRQALADQHANIRRQRAAHAMQLRAPVSMPPTADELRALHLLHQQRARAQQNNNDDDDDDDDSIIIVPPRVADYTFRSSTVIFPGNRNVHGKLFGGFVMEEAHILAQYTAAFFAKGRPIIPLGIDEAIFLQPIAIGDMVTFTARLVHSTRTSCRVLVVVEVRDPANRDRVPLRSNRLMIVFGGEDLPEAIVPETYSEILMHVDAQRRHQVEGPAEKEIREILKESKMIIGGQQYM
jgi:acyl-coenzyme A thioesterase 9